MSTNRNVANLSISIVKVLTKAAGFGFVADTIDGSQECLNLLADIKNDALGSPNAEMIRSLNGAVEDELDSIQNTLKHDGRSKKQIKQTVAQLSEAACETIKELAEDDDALIRAVQKPKRFAEELRGHAAPLPDLSGDEMWAHYETILDRIAEDFHSLAPWSPNFDRVALTSLLHCFPALAERLDRLKQDINEGFNSVREDAAAHYLDLKSEITSIRKDLRDKTPNSHPVTLKYKVWGSRPARLKHWIERHPTSNGTTLLDAIFSSPSSQRDSHCVLVGPAGSGKTRIAASIADRCEDEGWTLVAWIDAASDEKVKNQVIALSEENFSIQQDLDQDDTTRLNRALAAFPSQRDQNILLILDNADNYENLDKLLPTSPNIRIVVTTRHGKNWSNKKGWSLFRLTTFSREESMKLLKQATQDDDTFTANLIAERLDDLPLAIGRAANTCAWLNINKLKQYYSMLQKYPTEKLLDSKVATMDNQGVISALQIAGSTTLDHISDADVRNHAKNVLYTLCYLSEYGVPAQWFTDEHDLDSMCAYATLIDSSLVEETADGTTTTIHRLQAYAMRSYWHPTEQRRIAETISKIVTRQLNLISPAASTANDLTLTRSLIEQFRAMSDQSYSHFLFESSPFQNCLARTLAYAHHFELPEAITLGHAVLLIAHHTSSSPYSFKNEDARKDRRHSLIDELITRFDQLVTTVSTIWGCTYSEVLMARETLAQCYITAGLGHQALLCYESLLIDCEAALSKEHQFTGAVRESLEAARRELAQRKDDSPTKERSAQA